MLQLTLYLYRCIYIHCKKLPFRRFALEKRNIRILAILLIIAFFFSFIQTRPYSVRHSTVYTNDNTLEIELYIVTNRFFVIHPDQYCKEIIQKHRRINKLSADTTYQIVLFANSWCFKKGYSCAEYEYRVDNDKIQLQK